MGQAPGGEPGRAAGGGIGARLRAARERCAMSLEQAAQRLHVSVEVLAALEEEQFEGLGALIYVKSYLGRYAELLGESAEALQAQLADSTMAAPDLTRIPRAAPAGSRASALLAAAGIGAGVVLAVGLAWWGWTHLYRRAAAIAARSGMPTRPLGTPDAAARPVALSATPGAATSHRTLRPAAAVRRVAAAGSGLRISLHFPVSSWVSVTDANGHSLYRGLVLPGTLESFTGPAPLHVVLGNAKGVTLKVNGRAVPLAPYVGGDHATSIAVAADGRISPVPWHAGHAGG